MTKHTPGPWNREKIRYILRHASKQDIFWGCDDDGWEDKSPNIPDHYNDADSYLIASAPTMYENLTKIFELANDSNSNPHELLAKISQLAEAGIKEVEGK